MVGHESIRVKRTTGHKHENHFIEDITVRQIGKKTPIKWEYRVYKVNVMIVEVPMT